MLQTLKKNWDWAVMGAAVLTSVSALTLGGLTASIYEADCQHEGQRIQGKTLTRMGIEPRFLMSVRTSNGNVAVSGASCDLLFVKREICLNCL